MGSRVSQELGCQGTRGVTTCTQQEWPWREMEMDENGNKDGDMAGHRATDEDDIGDGDRDRGEGVEAGNGSRDWHYEEDGDKKWDRDHDRDGDRDGDRDDGGDGEGGGGGGKEARDGDRAGGSRREGASSSARNSDASRTGMLMGMMMMVVVAKRKVSATMSPSRMTPVSKLGQGEPRGPDSAGGPGGAVPALGGPGCVLGAGWSSIGAEPTGDLCSCLATPKPGLEASEAGDGGAVGCSPPHCPGGPSCFPGCPSSPCQSQHLGVVWGGSRVCREH